MSVSPRRKKSSRFQLWLFILLLLIAAGSIGLRYLSTGTAAPAVQEELQSTPTPSNTAEPTPEVTPDPAADTPAPVEETPKPESSESPASYAVEPYTEESYQLVNDMVYTYQYQQEAGIDAARALMEELKEKSPGLGTLWERIMEYWFYTNNEMEIYPEVLPDGLPEDDRLCIVVLGFQLESDGSMAQELIGRCQVALDSAKKYPNAYVAVTGGGTATVNTAATEAGAMAAWFREQGLDEKRLIIEDASLTTDQNAKFTGAILMEQYPQVQSLAIVSSDYHIPLGSMMFQEFALLQEAESGRMPFAVISNAAYRTPVQEFFTNPRNQASYVWFLAGPSYGD